jgi:hypothetical protein
LVQRFPEEFWDEFWRYISSKAVFVGNFNNFLLEQVAPQALTYVDTQNKYSERGLQKLIHYIETNNKHPYSESYGQVNMADILMYDGMSEALQITQIFINPQPRQLGEDTRAVFGQSLPTRGPYLPLT